MRSTTARIAVHGALLALAATAGCSPADATKAGGGASALTLRLGTDDVPGRPSAGQIEEFARQVDRLSDGRITVEPVWQAAGEGVDDWDQAVARLVTDGDLDLALVPSRAWDTEGVTTLRVLNAPFLVTDERLLADVVSGDLADSMLSGLEAAGVVGLGLFPEGLRHVFSFGEPLVTPDDYRGAVVRAPRSDTVHALFEALGATVDDYTGEAFVTGVDAGTIDAAESGFAIADTLPAPAVVAGNVTPYPKVNALVIDEDVARGMEEDDLDLLREAAASTRDWAIENAVPEADAAAEYCARGGTVVSAPPDAVAALEAAAEPVYEQLERDEATRTLVEAVRAAKAALGPAAPPATCDPSSEPAEGEQPTEAPPVSDGVYRYEVTAEYLVGAGLDPQQAREESGVHTVTLDDGRFEDAWINSTSTGRCVGTYEFDGPRITVSWQGGCVGDFAMTATVDGDEVRWSDIRSLPPHNAPEDQLVNEAFNSVPWVRVGDVPD